ncbi:hypothetical protein KR009_000506 [Drosophila setifemur]|nr:hypothetical protein KR009_000506 [Drosophila setifemur]
MENNIKECPTSYSTTSEFRLSFAMFFYGLFLISSASLISAVWTPGRIVGGHSVSISSAPWQASLQRYGRHYCGAAIYSEDIVITAAHCFTDSSPYGLTVRVGSSNSRSGGQVVMVSRVIIHENYMSNLSNDIAVLRLRTSLRLGQSVRSIPLAVSSPAPGSPASVTGWGSVGWNQPVSRTLRRARVDIVDQDLCRQAYDGGITNVMLCAAAPGQDSCQGDSGGPLVSGGHLVGIVSFGGECAHPNYPGVYADVAQLKSWILKAIQRIVC